MPIDWKKYRETSPRMNEEKKGIDWKAYRVKNQINPSKVQLETSKPVPPQPQGQIVDGKYFAPTSITAKGDNVVPIAESEKKRKIEDLKTSVMDRVLGNTK